MTITTISTIDLQTLLDVTEGYTSENGLVSAGRYAVPEAVQRAIIRAKVALRKTER